MALAIAKAQSVQLIALLYSDGRGSSGIDAAAQKDNSVCAGHRSRLTEQGSGHRVAFFVPTFDAFVEHFHVAVTVFIENAIGQTGQVMGTGSIERDRPIARNVFDEIFEFRERRGHGA